MSSIIEYLESEFATFDEKPFGAVDAAVLSQAAMLNSTGIVPSFPSAPSGLLDRLSAFLAPQLPSARFVDFARAERFDGMFTGLVPHDIKRCLFALIASPRFRDLAICGFQRVVDEAACTQFMATTYVWRDAFAFVAFGGTDISLAGWRENLDMAYCPETGAQRLARTYLEQAASHLPQRLLVGGHSKGGNLALQRYRAGPHRSPMGARCTGLQRGQLYGGGLRPPGRPGIADRPRGVDDRHAARVSSRAYGGA